MYSFLCGFLLVSFVCGSDLSLRGSGSVETTKINVTETERANRETITIDVQRMEVDRDEDGVFEDAKILKVNIRVSVIDGVVHINNSKAIHGSVTAFHFTAEIDVIGENKEVLKRTERVPILIRVLVFESQTPSGWEQTEKVLHVQEEIVEVNHKEVKQIKVTELVLQLDSANNEMIERRMVTMVELDDAEIHTSPQEDDTHRYPPAEGHLPSPPYFSDKKTMKPPKLPDSPYKADTTHDGLCSKFHKLPFGVRMAVFVLVAVIGLGTVSCCIWVFCCKSPTAGKKIDLKAYEDKFAYDGEFEAPALEQKIPIEKQTLVMDA